MWPHLKRISTRSKSRELEPLGEIKSAEREEHDNLHSKINSLTINLREMTFIDQNLVPTGKNRPPKATKGKQNFQNLSHRFSHFDQLNHENIKLKAKVDVLERKIEEQNRLINRLQNHPQKGPEMKSSVINFTEEGSQTLKFLASKFRDNLEKINKSPPLKIKEHLSSYKSLIETLDSFSRAIQKNEMTTRSSVTQITQSMATEEDQNMNFKIQDRIDFENIPIEKITLLGSLGVGGSSSVHKALYQGEEVAVKKIFRGGERGKELEKTFWQEVNIIKKIRHPKIILFMGTVKTEDHYYIVTEYMSKRSLDIVLKDKSITLDVNTKLKMAIDIVKGLCFLHSLDPPILHRDLKTANCLCNEHLEVKLADFGLAKLRDQNFNTNSIATVKYMAPEFISKQIFTLKSEIFSFGMILWEIFSQKEPFEQLNPTQALYAIAVNKRPEISQDTPYDLQNLIAQCWDQDPNQRPEFPDILKRLQEEKAKLE